MKKSEVILALTIIICLIALFVIGGIKIKRYNKQYDDYLYNIQYEFEIKNDSLIQIQKQEIFELLLKSELNIYNLKFALEYYEIKHPEIVLAQAILETGYFESHLCKNNNNLFGLYNSVKGEYFKFSHWIYSIEGYRDLVQYKYRNIEQDYYDFLRRLPYATDPLYEYKLRQIVKKLNY